MTHMLVYQVEFLTQEFWLAAFRTYLLCKVEGRAKYLIRKKGKMEMTNRDKAKEIADLPMVEQVNLLRMAARDTPPREVRGNTKNRFYAHECGLSPRVVDAMRKEGHGEEIFSGRGRNSGRWYFPAEILDRALATISSSHGRLKLYAESCRT